jgi:hypothetical protein
MPGLPASTLNAHAGISSDRLQRREIISHFVSYWKLIPATRTIQTHMPIARLR